MRDNRTRKEYSCEDPVPHWGTAGEVQLNKEETCRYAILSIT